MQDVLQPSAAPAYQSTRTSRRQQRLQQQGVAPGAAVPPQAAGAPPSRQAPNRPPLQDPRFRGTRPTSAPAAALSPTQPVPASGPGTVSIRAFDLPRDTRQPYQRRDADGGYGRPPPAAPPQPGPPQEASQAPAQAAPVPIDQWLEPAREAAREAAAPSAVTPRSGVVDEDWWGR